MDKKILATLVIFILVLMIFIKPVKGKVITECGEEITENVEFDRDIEMSYDYIIESSKNFSEIWGELAKGPEKGLLIPCLDLRSTANIVFDCKGHSIKTSYENLIVGGQNIETAGIFVGGENNIIKNCNIRGFYSGIRLEKTNSEITENNIYNNGVGLSVEYYNNAKNYNVYRNNIYSNEEAGWVFYGKILGNLPEPLMPWELEKIELSYNGVGNYWGVDKPPCTPFVPIETEEGTTLLPPALKDTYASCTKFEVGASKISLKKPKPSENKTLFTNLSKSRLEAKQTYDIYIKPNEIDIDCLMGLSKTCPFQPEKPKSQTPPTKIEITNYLADWGNFEKEMENLKIEFNSLSIQNLDDTKLADISKKIADISIAVDRARDTILNCDIQHENTLKYGGDVPTDVVYPESETIIVGTCVQDKKDSKIKFRSKDMAEDFIFLFRDFNYKIDQELKWIHDAERIGTIIDAITLPFNFVKGAAAKIANQIEEETNIAQGYLLIKYASRAGSLEKAYFNIECSKGDIEKMKDFNYIFECLKSVVEVSNK